MRSSAGEKSDPKKAAENPVHVESIRRDPLAAISFARQIAQTAVETGAVTREAIDPLGEADDALALAEAYQQEAEAEGRDEEEGDDEP